MSLATSALRALLEEHVEAGLSLGGKEVAVGGYQRFPLDRWNIVADKAKAEARFGPFDEPVSYDALVVFVNGIPEQVLPNEGKETARIPARAVLKDEVAISIRSAR